MQYSHIEMGIIPNNRAPCLIDFSISYVHAHVSLWFKSIRVLDLRCAFKKQKQCKKRWTQWRKSFFLKMEYIYRFFQKVNRLHACSLFWEMQLLFSDIWRQNGLNNHSQMTNVFHYMYFYVNICVDSLFLKDKVRIIGLFSYCRHPQWNKFLIFFLYCSTC